MRSTGKVAGEGRPPAKEMISGRWVIFRISRMNELCSPCARSENCHWMGLGFSIFMLVSQEGTARPMPATMGTLGRRPAMRTRRVARPMIYV
jgi:hypothetical protein